MNYTRHFECGCKVVVIGELTNVKIVYCPLHKSAPDMYEALKVAIAPTITTWEMRVMEAIEAKLKKGVK